MQRKFLFLLLFLFFLYPKGVEAANTTRRMYINIDVLENGSIHVEEVAELTGEYNGRLRNIEYRNGNARIFTGEYEDFSGSSIYNGSSIKDLKVCDTSLDISKNSFHCESEYREVLSGSKGQSGVYEREDTSNGINLKIYNPSSRKKAFYLSYTVSDVVVLHNDIAEIAWNILGYTYDENIKDFKVWVNLPKKDPDLRVWLKGNANNLNGEIRKENDKTAYIYYNFLGANNPVTVRMMFDKTITPQATKESQVEGKENILKTEQEAADQANAIRKKIKRQNVIVILLTLLWLGGSATATVFLEIAKRKNKKVDFAQDYYRDFPGNYGPEILEYLLKKNVTDKGMSASLLNIVDKKVLKVEKNEEGKNDYFLIRQNKEMTNLTENEKRLCQLFIEKIGDHEKVSLHKIKNYGNNQKNAKIMMAKYTEWKNNAITEGRNLNFFAGIHITQTITLILGILSIAILWLNVSLDTGFIPGYLSIVIGIAEAIYAMNYSFKTKEGALEYAKWQAFKRFLKDFGLLHEKELPEIALWGKYLVYATVLGCADEVEKAMKIHMETLNIESSSPLYLDYYYTNTLLHANLYSSIASSARTGISSSRSSIASSSTSSGSGFGGGSSFGGGSFGGGGGGGRF